MNAARRWLYFSSHEARKPRNSGGSPGAFDQARDRVSALVLSQFEFRLREGRRMTTSETFNFTRI
jgi:hypothetical protein